MLTNYLSDLPPFARSYIHHLSVINRSENTQVAYAQELIVFFQHLCDNYSELPSSPSQLKLSDLAFIQHTDIEAYLSWARAYRKNGVRALARKQASIRSLFRYLLKEDLITRDVTQKLDTIQVDQKLPKALEPEQVADLADILESGIGLSNGQLKYHNYTEKRDYAIILTFIGTGIRLSELCSLKLQSIDFNKGCFQVVRKGNKETLMYFNQDISDALTDYIKNERPRYAHYDPDALFLSIQGKSISKRAVQDLVKKYLNVLQAFGHNTEGFSAHKLRSTFATLLLRETDNLAIVQDALGHSDPRTTRIYAKVLDEQLRRAAHLIKFK